MYIFLLGYFAPVDSVLTLCHIDGIAEHAGAVWSMAVDAGQKFVAVGSVTNEIQVYAIRKASEAEQGATIANQGQSGKADVAEDSLEEVVSLFGTVEHETVQRVTHVCFSEDDAFLAACSTGALSS